MNTGSVIGILLGVTLAGCGAPALADPLQAVHDAASPDTTLLAPASEDSTAQPDAPDKCKQQPLHDKFPERAQAGMFRFSCRTVRWIDGLFGSSRDFREESVEGKLTFGFAWNEYEGWDPSLRYRVKMDLPNLSNRWDAFLGRVDEEDYISGSEITDESAFRRSISDRDRDDTEWLLGLGYKARDAKAGGWDHSVGIRLRTPPRIYVRTRYERIWDLSPQLDLRYRQTLFWRDGSTGFGTTTHLDSTRELNSGNLLRGEVIGKITEATDGLEWWVGSTWYHRLADQRGISLRAFIRGATDREVNLSEYGFELIWRRQVAREWLYINAGPTLTWPRSVRSEEREASFGFQVLMEMEFGYFRG